jgi:hypothetical protein
MAPSARMGTRWDKKQMSWPRLPNSQQTPPCLTTPAALHL